MRLLQDRILHIDAELKDEKVNIVAEWQGELVRCSDCEYRGDEIACPIDGNDLHHISDYDYCSYGKLKEGDVE